MSDERCLLSEVSLPYERVGRYRLIQRVGEGAFAEVYFGRDDETLAPVALKVLKPDIDPSIFEQVRVRFLAEEKITRAIDHRYVVHIQGTSEPDERPCYLAMDFVLGRPFCEQLSRFRLGVGGSVRPNRGDYLAEVARLGHQVAYAMARAHSRGIVHRDLKPQNVLVTREKPDTLPEVRIVDFGIAKAPVELFGVAAATSVTKYWTELGTVMGSPPYMAPEQRGAAQMATGQADVFALGVMLLGATLAIDLERLEQRSQALNLPEDLETALELRGPLPSGWETLLRAMLQEDASGRPTMSDVVLQLQRLARTDAEFADAVDAWVRHRRLPQASRLLKLARIADSSDYLTEDEREFLKQAPLQRLRIVQRRLRFVQWLGGGLLASAAAGGYWLYDPATSKDAGGNAPEASPARVASVANEPAPAMIKPPPGALVHARQESEQLRQKLAAVQRQQTTQGQQLEAERQKREQFEGKLAGCEARQRDLQGDIETLNEKLEERDQLLARCDKESDRLLVCRQETAVKSRELAETTQRLHTCTKSLRGLSAPPEEELQLGMSSPAVD